MFFALLMITTRMVKDTNDTVLMATQFFGTFAFGAVDGAVRLGDADAPTT